MTTTIYARCVAFVGDPDKEPLFGAYTIGKEYEVMPDDGYPGCDFGIIDDEGDKMSCWWDGSDPDCIWERVEV